MNKKESESVVEYENSSRKAHIKICVSLVFFVIMVFTILDLIYKSNFSSDSIIIMDYIFAGLCVFFMLSGYNSINKLDFRIYADRIVYKLNGFERKILFKEIKSIELVDNTRIKLYFRDKKSKHLIMDIKYLKAAVIPKALEIFQEKFSQYKMDVISDNILKEYKEYQMIKQREEEFVV